MKISTISDALREVLDQLGAIYLEPLNGFSRIQ